jgi:hypothetical protein
LANLKMKKLQRPGEPDHVVGFQERGHLPAQEIPRREARVRQGVQGHEIVAPAHHSLHNVRARLYGVRRRPPLRHGLLRRPLQKGG